MANRITKTPTFQPGHHAAKLAKALEDEAKAKKRASHEDAAECQSKSSKPIQLEPESHNGSKAIHQSDLETELVDSSSYRLHQSTRHANHRLVKRRTSMHFCSLILINLAQTFGASEARSLQSSIQKSEADSTRQRVGKQSF
jgi:hypothetical protein